MEGGLRDSYSWVKECESQAHSLSSFSWVPGGKAGTGYPCEEPRDNDVHALIPNTLRPTSRAGYPKSLCHREGSELKGLETLNHGRSRGEDLLLIGVLVLMFCSLLKLLQLQVRDGVLAPLITHSGRHIIFWTLCIIVFIKMSSSEK